MKIDLSRVIDAAFAQLDESGLDGLNMRALADRLGVYASALYWHVGSKDELVSLMARGIYRRAFDAARRHRGWREWLAGYAGAFRTELMRHRDSARLCALARPVGESAQESADRLAAPLVGAGLDRDTALSYIGSVTALTLGWAVYEQSRPLHDYLAGMIRFDESFASGLGAMVGGLPDPALPRIRGRKIRPGRETIKFSHSRR